MSETKKLHVLDNALGIGSGLSYGIRGVNLFYPFVSSGASVMGVDGVEINTRYLELRYNMSINGNSNSFTGPVYMEVYLVKSAQVWGSSGVMIPESGFPAGLFIQNAALTNWRRPIGLNKLNGSVVRVLKYKRKSFFPRPNTSVSPTSTSNYHEYGGKIKFRFKGKKVFAQNSFQAFTGANNVGILRDAQYYIMMKLTSSVAASSSYNVLCTFDYSMYFKDV